MSRSDSVEAPLGPLERAALDATGLAGRQVLGVDAAGAGIAIIVETFSVQMLEDWQRARDAVPTTGRWPVLVTGDGADWMDALLEADLFSRFYFREGMGERDPSPQGVLHSAEHLDVEARLSDLESVSGSYWRNRLREAAESELEVTRRHCGSAPDAEIVIAAIADAANPLLAADRFLFESELAQGCDPTPTREECWHLDPYDPAAHGGRVGLALLPTAQPWTVHAYISSLYDACGYGQGLVVAVARRWYDEFGAEPAALWGTMVQMVVQKPPVEREATWRVARVQSLLAENTTASAGVSVREHARCLLGRRDWFLHSRP